VYSALERRIRRIASVVMALAIVAGGIGILDGEIAWSRRNVVAAGGPCLVTWVVIVCFCHASDC
jgi:hypothetical protein